MQVNRLITTEAVLYAPYNHILNQNSLPNNSLCTFPQSVPLSYFIVLHSNNIICAHFLMRSVYSR